MAEKTPEEAGGTADNTPETVSDLRQAVEQKLDDLFSGLDEDEVEDEDEEPTVTVLQEGAEITLPDAAPAFDADRSKPAAATAPRKPPVAPPAESKTVEHRTAPAPAPPPKPRPDPPKKVATPQPEAPGPAAAPSKKTDVKGTVERPTAQPKPAGAPPPKPKKPVAAKPKKPVTAPAPSTGHAKAKPQIGRILIWGALLGFVVFTVIYFKTYEPQTPPASTAERGLLFHKVAPPLPPPFGQKSARSKASAPPSPASIGQKSTPSTAPAPPAAAAKRASTHEKPAGAPPAAVSAYVEGSYPWAIHIASYRDSDFAREKAAEFYVGLQAFLVYTDLGDKGVWYRLYFGHFPDASSTVDAIKKYGLKDAVAGHTRYACLMGSYASVTEARAITDRLNAKGFFPYTLNIGNAHHVLVGAHPTLGGAQHVSVQLSKAGYANRVIKR